jgi:uncharacterized protein (TIGR02001 family)
MRGSIGKTALVAGSFALLLAGTALAADAPVKGRVVAPPPPPMFDVAISGLVMTDYNFRGVSQSNRAASGGAAFEAQLNIPFGQLYAGVGALAISWPAAFGFTNPSAEVDFIGGWRHTFGKFSVDLGFIYYHYPAEIFNGITSDSDFWEVYAKFGVEPVSGLTLGAAVYYTPDLLNYSASFLTLTGAATKADAVYAALTAQYNLPWKAGDLGAYISGELGHWWINGTGFLAAGFIDPDYTYWNLGVAFTYKALTLDLRYHGNDMNAVKCGSFLLAGVPNPSNRWCEHTFIAALKFATNLSNIK